MGMEREVNRLATSSMFVDCFQACIDGERAKRVSFSLYNQYVNRYQIKWIERSSLASLAREKRLPLFWPIDLLYG